MRYLLLQSPKQRNSNERGPYSVIGGWRPARRIIAGRKFDRAAFAFLWAVALFLPTRALIGQQPDSVQPVGATLRGVVHDSAGKAVAGAHVILKGDSPPASREEITDAAGQFSFKGVATGTYSLTASLGSVQSATIAATIATPGEQKPLNLVLGGPQTNASTAQRVSQSMQFADQPDFAIAGVTDWTAAGGHGSDSSLRTSEALTRQAVNLKPGSTEPGAGSSGGATTDDELAKAVEMAANLTEARDHVRRLLARGETADLHRMDGELDEKLGEPVAAVQAFQEATRMDPSEANYFAWGSELLIHRAVWQAKEVFDEGTKRYPQSVRMLTARGVDLFAGALYDEAALDLCKASDLDPDSTEPYLFMGKIEIAAPNPLPCVVEKLSRFEKLQPNNSLANFYYAMALKKQQGHDADPRKIEQVKDLLTRAVTLDPRCAEGYLELGNLSAGEKQWPQAIALYLQAIQADPDLSDAHYRLGVAYERNSDPAKATEQFKLHDAIASRQAAEVQRQREAVKQFVVVLPNHGGALPDK